MTARKWLIRVARSGRLPVVLLSAATLAVLVAYDVTPMDVLLFAGYVTAGIALPGMLLVRALRPSAAHRSEDLALGLALGFSMGTASYVVARAAGIPQLHVLWAVVTLVVFVAVPRLRRHWRPSPERAPLAWTWAICAILAVLLAHSAGVFTTHRLVGVDTPYVDMPYHLALIGELRHHVPPEVPFVAGEPLAYHWFFYVQAAATSWTTGIEPVVVLYRLAVLPMIAGFVVLTAATARRLTERWWPGPVAVVLALWSSVAAPYRWLGPTLVDRQPVFTAEPLTTLWISPTHAFGLLLFGAVLVVFIDRLGPHPEVPHLEWLLAALLVFGASGAKASALPVLLAGLVTVLSVAAIRRQTIDRHAAAIAICLVVAGLVFAVTFVFGGTTGGLQVGLDSLRRFPIAASVGAARAGGISALAIPAIVLAIAIVLWVMQWSGALALAAGGGHARKDARLWLLLGAAAGGLGAATLLSYPGQSQLYYLRGSAAVFGLLAAWGIAGLAGPRPGRRMVAGVAIALAAGAGIAGVIYGLGPSAPPRPREGGLAAMSIELLAPIAVILVCLGVGLLVARLVEGRAGIRAGILVVSLAMGFGLPTTLELVARPVIGASPAGDALPEAGVEAARWLRDHSSPGDLVAANLHCRPEIADGRCDARHFWVSAFSERRVLVEGWAYTAKAFSTPRRPGLTDGFAPFWDPERLAINDLAFTSPASGVGELRDRYGVRWLFADLDQAEGGALANAATERFRAGRYAVYQVP